jgi:hypothetical protein
MGRRKEYRKEGIEERYGKTGEHVKGKGGERELERKVHGLVKVKGGDY